MEDFKVHVIYLYNAHNTFGRHEITYVSSTVHRYTYRRRSVVLPVNCKAIQVFQKHVNGEPPFCHNFDSHHQEKPAQAYLARLLH